MYFQDQDIMSGSNSKTNGNRGSNYFLGRKDIFASYKSGYHGLVLGEEDEKGRTVILICEFPL